MKTSMTSHILQKATSLLLGNLCLVLILLVGAKDAVGQTTLLNRSFVSQTTTTTIPTGWTGYQYRGSAASCFSLGANGAVVSNGWNRCALDSNISINSNGYYIISIETYASNSNQNCVFYLSSDNYSICIGNSYTNKNHVYIGHTASAASGHCVSYEPNASEATPTVDHTCSTVNVGTSLAYTIILDGNSLEGTVSDSTNKDDFSVQIADSYSFNKIGIQLDGAAGTVGIKSIKVVQLDADDFRRGDYVVFQSAWTGHTDRYMYCAPSGPNTILSSTNDRYNPNVVFQLQRYNLRGNIATLGSCNWLYSPNVNKWSGYPSSTTAAVNMVAESIKNTISQKTSYGWGGIYSITHSQGYYQIADNNPKNTNNNKSLTLLTDNSMVVGGPSTSDASHWNLIKVFPYSVQINEPTANVTYGGTNLYGASAAQPDGGLYYFSTPPSVSDFTPDPIADKSYDLSVVGNTIKVNYFCTTSPTSIMANGANVAVGHHVALTYSLSPLPCWDRVTFASNNPAVATVDANTGVVTGVSEGTATITLSAHEYGTNDVVCTTAVEIHVVDMLVIFLNSRGTIANGGDSEDNTGNTTFGLAAGSVYGTHTVGQGNDANDGLSPETPVSTWSRAYSLLDSEADGGTWDNQVIVVMGYVDNTYFSVGDRLGTLSGANPKDMSVATKPVHITGQWDGVDYQGAIGRCPTNNGQNEYYSGFPVNADTKFSHLQLFNKRSEVKCYFVFYAHFHNLYFGEGLIMKNMPVGDVSTLGGAQGCVTTNAHIFGGYFNLQYIPTDHPAYVNKNTQDRKDINPKPDGFTITIKSGYWGVVSVGGRGGESLITGSPEAPLKGRIVIDIDHENSNTSANAALAVRGNTPCNYDVGCILAGNHGGTLYADSEIDIYEGTISRVVNGTLGQVYRETGTSSGYHKTSGGTTTATPFDSFFGRAVVNVTPRDGDNSKVKIKEFYCGGLGRHTGTSNGSETQTNFYGHSVVNINGGTFEKEIFGSGAGGTNGVGLLSNWNTANNKPLTDSDGTPLHCKDKLLPYWVSEVGNVNDRNVLYGPDNANLVDITVKDFADDGTYTTQTFNIRDTKTTITINGGIFGTADNPASIYAGGWGEVNTQLINYTSQTPSTQAGDIFGATMDGICSELIINGGTIYGNVYGAGKGSTTYYDYYNSLASKKSPGNNHDASEFLNLGTIVGSTRVFVGGNAQLHGNLFGGGDNGQLMGDSHVEIDGNSNVQGTAFGGGHQANVVGSAEVTVNGGYVSDALYGGGALANTGNTEVKLYGGSVADVYGGGLGRLESGTVGETGHLSAVAATVGSSTIHLGKTDASAGSIVRGNIYGCNNLNGTPTDNATVYVHKTTAKSTETASDPYHVAGIYGGGNKAAYAPTGGDNTTKVFVYNCDNSIRGLYGGGNAASVPATYVEVSGGNIDSLFAGGNGQVFAADVTGDVSLLIKGGTIKNIYGGSNTNGTIGGTSHVTVNAETDGCNLDITNLYSGGNMAPGKAGMLTISCTGEGKIDNVFGGANNADIGDAEHPSDITLLITGGNLGNVFGGNNNGGTVHGTITVIVDWDNTCYNNHINNVYGGGNLTSYAAPTASPDYPKVFIRNATINHDVFGGGLGANAHVIGNPQVKIGVSQGEDADHSSEIESHQVTIAGSVYGGGSQAPVTGNTSVIIDGRLINGSCSMPYKGHEVTGILIKGNVFGGGLGSTAVIQQGSSSDKGNTFIQVLGNSCVEQNVYGGGNGGVVEGDTSIIVGE